MKINKLEVNNLNGRSFSVDTQNGLTLFLAPNGAGKSSLVKALNIAMGDKPTDIEPGYAVRMTVNEGVRLAVKKSASKTSYYINEGSVSQDAYNDVVIKEASEEGMAPTTKSIRVTTTSELYNAAESKNLMEYLLPHMAPTLNADRVMAFSPVASDLAEKELRAVLPPMPEPFGLSKLDEAYKALTVKRRDMNADLKAERALYNGIVTTPVTRTLEEVETEKNAFILAHKDEATLIDKMRDYNKAVEKAEEQQKLIKAAEEEIAKIDEKLNGNTATEENKQIIANYRKKKEKIKEEQTAVLTALNNDIKLLENALRNINKPVCPISAKLICTTDKTGVKAELEESLAASKKAANIAENTLMEVENALEKCTQQEKKWEEYHKLEEDKKPLLATLKTLKETMMPIPEKPACSTDTTVYDETLRRLNVEAANITSALDKEKRKKKINELEVLTKTLDQLVKALDAKGEIKAQCADVCLRDINAMLEDRAGKVMPGFSIRLENYNGITVFAKTPNNNNWTEHKRLSSGEKIAVSVLMMDFINQMVPTNIMIVDNIEQLDRETLEKLRDMVTSPEVNTWYNNVFLLGVDHDDVCDVFSSLNATRITSTDVKIMEKAS